MAIRVAIGATPSSVLQMILREAAGVAAIGIAAGTLAAFAGGRSLQSVLFGIVAGDPVVLGASALGMLLVVLAATLDPARRASRADPNSLLRAE
jgi:ABC-type antimicrobial peptide transport system permease subunit